MVGSSRNRNIGTESDEMAIDFFYFLYVFYYFRPLLYKSKELWMALTKDHWLVYVMSTTMAV